MEDSGSRANNPSNSTADDMTKDRNPSSHGNSLCGREQTTGGNVSDPRLKSSSEGA